MPKELFEIMHKDRCVAQVDTVGNCRIYCEKFMPYLLYLEETNADGSIEAAGRMDYIETLVNNVTNFYYWCAARVLTLDRTYAKELLNSIGVKQAVTDKDRAEIALSYRCVSLTDVYWVKRAGEHVKFADVNLYENHLDNSFMDIALRGRQYTVQNEKLAQDLSTNGCFPKAWQRKGDGFRLFKDGGENAVDRELLASRICRCFDVSQVLYEADIFDGEKVSVSENFTSQKYSIVPMEAFSVYALNHDLDVQQYILRLDPHNYYMMNIIDYLVGNTDRHWGNWGLLVDNADNQPVCLHRLMDFNQSFSAYDTLDGANCQTVFGQQMTQKEAAQIAVCKIGLNQTAEINRSFFNELPQYFEMFERRLDFLKQCRKAELFRSK